MILGSEHKILADNCEGRDLQSRVVLEKSQCLRASFSCIVLEILIIYIAAILEP